MLSFIGIISQYRIYTCSKCSLLCLLTVILTIFLSLSVRGVEGREGRVPGRPVCKETDIQDVVPRIHRLSYGAAESLHSGLDLCVGREDVHEVVHAVIRLVQGECCENQLDLEHQLNLRLRTAKRDG